MSWRVPEFRTVTVHEAANSARKPTATALILRWDVRGMTVVSYDLASPNQMLAFTRLLRRLNMPALVQQRDLVGRTYTTFKDYEYDPRTNF